MSQLEMATALYTTQGSYSQFENNNRQPSMELVLRVIELSKVDANWLLQIEDPKSMQPPDEADASLNNNPQQEISGSILHRIEEKLNKLIEHNKY